MIQQWYMGGWLLLELTAHDGGTNPAVEGSL